MRPINKKKFKLALCYSLSFATVGLGFVLPVFWASMTAAAIIIGLALYVARAEGFTFLGLAFTKSAVLSFFVTFLLSAVLVLSLFAWGVDRTGSVLVRWVSTWSTILITVLLQSFAEEILFRAFLTRDFLLQRVQSVWFAAVISACFFSVAHWVNYRLSEGVNLTWSPLLSLFLLGLSGTILFLKQGHLMGAWGFHAGWNFIRFSFEMSSRGKPIAESTTFEIIEGSTMGLGLASLLALAALYPTAAKASLYAQAQKNDPISPRDINPPKK
jgi:membrane protease YdiL (CAAX protease family)